MSSSVSNPPAGSLAKPRVSDSRLVHWLAWLTLVSSLLPVGIGAVVTTVDAGMAFADWPTSDGQGMLAYPWLKSTGDKFLEHGHRLAGMVVGFLALLLLAAALRMPIGPARRGLAIAVFAGVVMQGLLGGARVELESRGIADGKTLAMIHGNFAVLATTLMVLLVQMTSRWWQHAQAFPTGGRLEAGPVGQKSLASGQRSRLCASAVVLLLCLASQYILGSQLRHLATAHAWLAHPWFAIAVVVASLWFSVECWLTARADLRRASSAVLLLLVCQALLGVATWALLYGYPQFDIMAVQQSSVQTAVRSLHKVLAWIATLTTMAALFTLWRVWPVSTRALPRAAAPEGTPFAGALG